VDRLDRSLGREAHDRRGAAHVGREEVTVRERVVHERARVDDRFDPRAEVDVGLVREAELVAHEVARESGHALPCGVETARELLAASCIGVTHASVRLGVGRRAHEAYDLRARQAL
jgi:hypothetical protein